MHPEDLCLVGYVGQPKSLKGEVKAYFEAFLFDHIHELKGKMSYLLIHSKEGYLPYFIENLQILSDGFVTIKFEDINTREQAMQLQKKDIYLEIDKLPDHVLAQEEDLGWEAIIGFTLIDATNQQVLGTIDDVYYLPEHELASFFFQGHEILLPLHDDLIESIDEAAKTISVSIPDGLLNVYLATDTEEDKDTD